MITKSFPAQKQGKVLVLGRDNRSCLSVVRSLGRQNIEVHLGWSFSGDVVQHSKYIHKIYEIPAYQSDDDAWKKTLLSIFRSEKYDLVIPCSDPTTLPLQRHRSDFEPLVQIYLLNDDIFEIVVDKARLYKLAVTLGINIPRHETCSSIEHVDGLVPRLGLPLILKPISSFKMENLRRKNHVRRADNEEEIKLLIQDMLGTGEVQAQSYFTGKGVGVEILASEGEIVLAFQHERIHEPIGGGGSSYRKSVSLSPELLSATKKLIKALSYTGVAMVEFMVNVKTGAWILVEINGRFWGSLPLALASGVDFPYALYQLLVNKKKTFQQDYRHPIFCRNTSLDFQWIIDQVRVAASKRKHPNFPLLTYLKGVIHLLQMRERNDTLVWDDLKPGILEVKQLIGSYTGRLTHKLQMHFLSRPSNRKRYVKRARRAVKNAANIIFICKGNICRSPFAEYYARTIFPKSIGIRSCGYFPIKDRMSPEDALSVSNTFGIDLSGHRSKLITEALLQQADVVFIFDEENKKFLEERFPFASHKIYFLGALSPAKDIIIKDPYGGGLEGFKSVYQTVALAVDTLFSDAVKTDH